MSAPDRAALRRAAARVRRDAKYLTPAHRGPLLSSATELLELREAVARVRDLHRDDGTGDCTECAGINGMGEFWPCPTIEALDGEE